MWHIGNSIAGWVGGGFQCLTVLQTACAPSRMPWMTTRPELQHPCAGGGDGSREVLSMVLRGWLSRAPADALASRPRCSRDAVAVMMFMAPPHARAARRAAGRRGSRQPPRAGSPLALARLASAPATTALSTPICPGLHRSPSARHRGHRLAGWHQSKASCSPSNLRESGGRTSCRYHHSLSSGQAPRSCR